MNGENTTRRTSLFLYGALCVILIFSMAPLVAFLKIALSSLWDANKSLGAAGTISSFLSRIPVSTIVRSLKFTLSQSLASTLLAVAIGLPGAWFAARFRFAGRKALLALAAVPFCFPPILVILAFILYYGKEGFLSSVRENSIRDFSIAFGVWSWCMHSIISPLRCIKYLRSGFASRTRRWRPQRL